MGVAEKIAPFAARAIRPFLPEQHRDFFSELSFLVLCARTATGHPALTSLTGAPGFSQSPNPTTSSIDALPAPGDPLFGCIQVGSDVGILGLLPHLRRRNRANGIVSSTRSGGFDVEVVQSFGNCKQHIRNRLLEPAMREAEAPRHADSLDGAARRLVETADTFFIGTGAPGEGLDASHRGGPAGLVRVLSPSALVFPDYGGNNFYNTVGNLLRDPRVALLFIDFDRGDLLHITGRATISWQKAQDAGPHPRVERLIRVDIESVAYRPAAWSLTTSSRTAEGEAIRRR